MLSNSQPPPDDVLVIGITGRIAAGKTTAGKYLNSKYGFQYLRYSQVLSDWLANDSQGNPHLQKIGWEVMEKGMQSDLNRRLIAQIKPYVDVAVDGLRHPLDYECLKKTFPSSFHLLFIDTSPIKRWDRKKIQSRYATLDAFEAADAHPVEQQIELFRPRATEAIRNEGTLQVFYVSLDEAIGRLRTGKHI